MGEAERELLLYLAQAMAELNPGINAMLNNLSNTVVDESNQKGWLREVNRVEDSDA